MGYLFENMEKIDVQAERRNTKEALKALEKQKAEVAKRDEDIKKTNNELNMVYSILIQKYKEQGMECEQVSLLLQQECNLGKAKAEELVNQFFDC